MLRELYGTVTITRLVKDEVTGHADRPGARELETAMREGWIRVAPAPPETWAFPALDSGEASTIALAREHAGSLVLMDDALGREQAAALGLETLGVAGVLLTAKRAGIVKARAPAARPPRAARLRATGRRTASGTRRGGRDERIRRYEWKGT